MFSCIGFSILGQCSYDPGNPSHVYYSIGEAIAALIIILIIPQFMKPIYKFRLETQAIRLDYIYVLVFFSTLSIFISALLPNIDIPRDIILSYPVFWELIGGFIYLISIFSLAYAFLKPARIRLNNYRRFVQAAAELLAHAEERDQSDFANDLRKNIRRLISASNFLRGERRWSAFYIFRYRKKISQAESSAALLQLISEPKFCGTLVHRRPWDTASMLQQISSEQLFSGEAKNFIQEIGRQAIILPSSMMEREISHTGFRVVPFLTEAIFADRFIGRFYQPLQGLRYDDFRIVNANKMKRLNHAVTTTLRLALEENEFSDNRNLSRIEEHYEIVIRTIKQNQNTVTPDPDLITDIHFFLQDIIDVTEANLNEIEHSRRESLYADPENNRDYNLLDQVSEIIFGVIKAISNDFKGHEDSFWFLAIGIMQNAFPKFGNQPAGMSPLQQRLAIKLSKKLSKNMEGWYPSVSRVLLATIGPFDQTKKKRSYSAFSILERAVYAELRKFPSLYANDPKKAEDFLPQNVRYDAKRATLIHRFSGGSERRTVLRKLNLRPVDLAAKVNRRRENS